MNTPTSFQRPGPSRSVSLDERIHAGVEFCRTTNHLNASTRDSDAFPSHSRPRLLQMLGNHLQTRFSRGKTTISEQFGAFPAPTRPPEARKPFQNGVFIRKTQRFPSNFEDPRLQILRNPLQTRFYRGKSTISNQFEAFPAPVRRQMLENRFKMIFL